VGPGVVILQIDATALAARGWDRIEADLARFGDLLEVVPARGVVLRVADDAALSSLLGLDAVEAAGPYRPAFKISPVVGRMPLLERRRAESRRMDLEVTLWHGVDATAAAREIGAITGASSVAQSSLDGSVLSVEADTGQLVRLAGLDSVARIEERPEYTLQDSEAPTILMIGSMEEGFGGARPFHDAGVDGGGIDTNHDGRRLNDGSDAVPPQIVAMTDNGVSYDAVHLAETTTQGITSTHPIGSTHRKIQAIQNAGDASLSTCDSILSGGTTHGNVVAGVIAGNPGELGFTYTKAINPEFAPPVGGISLDGLARGARIIMQDAGVPGQCTLADLVEFGGNVSPGNLIDRLNQAICPKSGGTGACTGLIGGGGDVHLHVMPFGTPNFDLVLGNDTNGQYLTSSRQIDLFLVNNRDYMVFSPVGNEGEDVHGGKPVVRWPDLLDCTILDDDPAHPSPLQVSPPATAKNSVTVGAMMSDAWTLFPGVNTEEFAVGFSSKGPATAASLRTAPLVMAVGDDGPGALGYPLFQALTTIRSRDNDNLPPVVNEIDEGSRGTSFAAALAAAAG
ncbi:MAG TPA: S8 family serine peptidase, partial [Candidatus Polarisedimenticolia bacterium]|nr:S8 family serine peptidase [Candidatus Polarisedimenticolia bacterium]